MKPQLSIEAFSDWCEKQPADRRYNYIDSSQCACFLYSAAIGMETHGGLPIWRKALYGGSPFWYEADDAAASPPWTFGALTARLQGHPQ